MANSFPFIALPQTLTQELISCETNDLKKKLLRTTLLNEQNQSEVYFFPEDDKWLKPIYQDYFFNYLKIHPGFTSSNFCFKVRNKFTNGSFYYMNIKTGFSFIIKIFEPNEIIEFNEINNYVIGFTEKQIFDEPEPCANLANSIITAFQDKLFPFTTRRNYIIYTKQDSQDLVRDLTTEISRKDYIPKNLQAEFEEIEKYKKKLRNINRFDDSGLPF